MSGTLIIGIAGGTGSGKTTLTRRLVEKFADNISVVYHDNYYKAHNDLTYDERSKLNYDHPEAFDTELMIQHLQSLKDSNPIECPVYDYKTHNRSADLTTVIRPAKVVVVEGILIFHNLALRSMMDIKIFVDTDADVRILRRILRDVQERRRSLDSVVTQYLNTVKPMHEQFVEPSKRHADIVVLEGGYNPVALDMIMQRIQGHVQT